MDEAELRLLADRIRGHVVDLCAGPEGGHLGGSLSLVDLLTVLYFAVLRVDPTQPRHPDRDILVLSKGHAALALYATLAERGFFPSAALASYGQPESTLLGHPAPNVPGIDAATGSLGHGLAVGAGFALAARLRGRERRVFVVLGDGELQEGSIWEAALAAAHLGLDRLVAIVDRNGLQLTGPTEEVGALEPLAEKWASFGWRASAVDGHAIAGLIDALSPAAAQPGRPTVLIADTVKGHGVDVAAGRVSSHYVSLSTRNHARFRAGLGRPSAAERGEHGRD